jgi:hypothetical protein
LCFEPSPRHWAPLLEKAVQFKDRYKIALYPFGLGKEDCCRTFWQKQYMIGDSFIKHLGTNPDFGYEIKAVMIGVAHFLLQNIKPTDVLHVKIDCEGSEYGILQGLLACPWVLPCIKRLLLETHDLGPDIQTEIELLTAEFQAAGIQFEPWPF